MRKVQRMSAQSLSTLENRHIKAAEPKVFQRVSSRTERESALAAKLNESPVSVAQRRMSEMIHSSEKQRAMQARAELANCSAVVVAQRQASGHRFSVAALELKQREAAEPQSIGRTAAKSGTSTLPLQLRSGIERLSGMEMDHVQVHYNSSRPAQLNALAFAQGHDIHLGPGQEQQLPHEAWHVVQQSQGRVKPTVQLVNGVQINDDSGLEREADLMGDNAVRFGGSPGKSLYSDGVRARHGSEALRVGNPVQAKLATTSEALESVHRTGLRGFFSKMLSGETTFDGIIVLLKQYESLAKGVESYHDGGVFGNVKGGLADKARAEAHQEDVASLEVAGQKVIGEIEKWFGQPSRKGQEEKDKEKIEKLRALKNEITSELQQIRNKRKQEEEAASKLAEAEPTANNAERRDESPKESKKLSFYEMADNLKQEITVAYHSAFEATEKAEKAHRKAKKALTAADAEKYAIDAENQANLAEQFARNARDVEGKFSMIAKSAQKERDMAAAYIERMKDEVRRCETNALECYKSAQNHAYLADLCLRQKRNAEARKA